MNHPHTNIKANPILSSTSDSLSFKVPNLTNYISEVNKVLLSQTLRVDQNAQIQINRLRNTLIRLEVEQIKKTAISQQIWDFYPTNTPLIKKMLEIAQLQHHHSVLEPSAGAGDLAKAIKKLGVSKVDCFELQPLLQKALKIQGFNLVGCNFLGSTPQPIYDRIIANPPFGNNGVAHHTQHAFKFLKPGGKLITLAHHYLLKPSETDKTFFAWLKHNHARFLNCGKAFAQSDRKTNVSLQIILINKS